MGDVEVLGCRGEPNGIQLAPVPTGTSVVWAFRAIVSRSLLHSRCHCTTLSTESIEESKILESESNGWSVSIYIFTARENGLKIL